MVHGEIGKTIEKIGMGRFASAMMWVIAYIFEGKNTGTFVPSGTLGPSIPLFCAPKEDDGRFLLGEIVRSGNFGHFDDRKSHRKGGYFNSFMGSIFRNTRYLRFNPFDWFWSPLWRLYYFAWRKCNGYH